MRLLLVAAGLLVGSVFLAGGSRVHAESQNNQTEQPKLVQVQQGDYLAKIAVQNNTTYPRLYDANENIKDPDVIFPGETLRIPAPDEHLPKRPLPGSQPAVAASNPPAGTAAVKTSKPAAVPARPSKPQSAAVVNTGGGSTWDRLAKCESGGNWGINTGNGYYGGLQFSLSSWRAVGGSGYPHQASREEQISRAEALKSKQGWGAWPACSSKLGLR